MLRPAAACENNVIDNTTAFFSHKSAFAKDYDKMRHVKYNLFWRPYTVSLNKTTFNTHNREHFLFLFQMTNSQQCRGSCWFHRDW